MNFKTFLLMLSLGGMLASCSSDENINGSYSECSIKGFSQKGPVLAGASVVVQELDSATFLQTGKSFKGRVISDNGEFLVENMHLEHPYVLLEVNGYFRNEVTGKNSEGPVFMNSVADVSENSKVNINLLTHLEYERVQALLERKKMSIAEAKRVADREIIAAFFDDDDYGKVESLDILGSGKGDAMLLALNVLLLGQGKEADFMERFAKLGNDLAADGVWNDSLLKAKIADDACEMDLDGRLPVIRKNIEDWKIANNVASFEPFVTSFWENLYGLGKCDATNQGESKKNSLASSMYYGRDFVCEKSGRWVSNLDAVRAGCDSCGFVVDPRDGRKYRTVKIAGINWMAENLAYNGNEEGLPFHEDESYGLLYEMHEYWTDKFDSNDGEWGIYGRSPYGPPVALRTTCPTGWRFPTREEFARLLEATSFDDYKLLLSEKGWNLHLGYEEESVRFLSSTKDSVNRAHYLRWGNAFYAMYAWGSEKSLKTSVSHSSFTSDGVFIRCVEDKVAERDLLPSGKVLPDSFVDGRDGKTYKTLKFGNQVWMAQNLEYAVGDSVVYFDDNVEKRCEAMWKVDPSYHYPDPCEIGWRYNWQEVQEVCPEGWKIPSRSDVHELITYVGGGAGRASLFTSDLKNSQDVYGFSALATDHERGSCGLSMGGCSYLPLQARFWTSDSVGGEPYVWILDEFDFITKSAGADEYIPVRCMKNVE